MSGKILIYGGSGGMGSAIGRILKARGFDLHLVAKNKDKLEVIAQELDASYTVGNVIDLDLFSRVINDVDQTLDGLVYAVGTINLRSIQRLNETDFINDFRINAMGAALAVQTALPKLKKSSGPASIVLFSSIAALQGFSFHASIGMAKGAVAGLTLSLAAELAPKIRVNAIAPSLTRTPLANGITSNEEMATSIARMHALQRLGSPEDIATIAAFLISSDSAWITGQIIGVDGGRSTLRIKS
jgi:NAD(P)-dependent dehydrogenase (short-subunit alcohol dehydrogenase family)